MSASAVSQTHTIPVEYLVAGDVIVGYEQNGPVVQAKDGAGGDVMMVRWADDMESFYVDDEVEVVDRYLADGRPARTAGNPAARSGGPSVVTGADRIARPAWRRGCHRCLGACASFETDVSEEHCDKRLRQ